MRDLITRLMTLTHDGVLRHTFDDGRILLANRSMAQILDLDCTPEDLAGRYLKDLLIFTEPADTLRNLLKKGHGEVHDCLYRFRTLKGKDKLAIYNAVLINDPKTGLQIVEAIIKDVTDIQRTADFLKESEQRFSQIAETATDMIWEVDASGRYTYRSASAETILGYSNREVVGHKYFFDFFTPETRVALKKAALDIFARKEPFRRFVNPNVHKNGRTVILETSGAPILDKDGNLIGYRGTDKDITAYIDAENALKESESRYRRLVDNTDTGFVVIDDMGIVLEANDPYMRLIGATKKEDAIGHSVVEWTAPEEQMNNAAAVARCAKQGHIQDFETIYRRTDGTTINILVNATVQESPHGKRLVSFCRDITERKRAEAALAQEKERLAITLQSIGDGVIATDIQGRIMLVNKIASELTGWPEKEAVGRPLTEVFRIINERTRRPCENPVKQVLQMGITVGLANHTALVARDGTVRNIADSGAPIHDSQGRVNGVVLVFRDVTEQRKLAEELSRTNQELETLIRIVTHDLRSPLVNIQGFSQILDRTCDEITRFLTAAPLADEMRRTIVSSHEKIEKSLRFINASVDKMNGLISGLLRLSRLGRAPLVSKPVDMNALIKAVLEAMTFQLRTAAAEVTADALPACQGDATLINQVCSNLLDNAIKYRDRTRPLRVRIWGRREGAQSVYCIEDNGLGMAPDHQQKIWNVFYRPNPQENVVGDGIGLSAVKLIVDRHGGKVWMESEVGKGSRFFLSLPAVAEEQSP